MDASIPTFIVDSRHGEDAAGTLDPAVLDWMGDVFMDDSGNHDYTESNLSSMNRLKVESRPPLASLDPYSFQTIRHVDDDSDGSWTEEDDNGTVFFEIEQQLRSFHLADHLTNLTTQALTKQQRRVVHAIAHLMHLGHSSIKSDGKVRRIHIFKKKNGSLAAGEASRLTESGYLTGAESGMATWLDGVDEACDLSRRMTAKRLPKKERGFPCRFSDCLTTFDRACDRRKHEKRHEPKDSHPYRCWFEHCNKTFLYPKDLRRHERIHNRKELAGVVGDECSTDEMFSDASFSSVSGNSSMVFSNPSANSTGMLSFLDTSDEDFGPMTSPRRQSR